MPRTTFIYGLLLMLMASTALASPSGDEVRVVLGSGGRAAQTAVTAQRGARLFLDTGSNRNDAWLDLDRESRMDIHARGREVQLNLNGKSYRADRILIDAPVNGSNQLGAIRYRGTLEFSTNSSTHLQVVNSLPLEDYVAAVVASEYGLNDIEGARAMAIVARTYALAIMASGGKLMDDERSQVYRGEKQLTPAAINAAQSTAGMVLTHEGELIEAVYSSSNGGYTAANANVWDTNPMPYLIGREDRFDAVSPHSNWVFDIDKKALHALLSRQYGTDVRSVEVTDTAADGRVRRVALSSDRVVSGTAFRATIAAHYGVGSARSTFFSLSERNGAYRLEGRGFGHGVGLSQYGAHGRALAGHSFQDILAFYYPAANLDVLESAKDPGSLLELPVLARLSDAPSNEGSGVNPIPEEKSSTFSLARPERTETGSRARVIDAHAAWGRGSAKAHVAIDTPAPADTSSSRRRGW